MKKSRAATIFAALSLSAGISIVGSGAADAAKGERHFIKISTHNAPLWSAKATLYDGQGNEVYHWNQPTKSGGGLEWYFTDGGDGGNIKITVNGQHYPLPTKARNSLGLDRDHCFLVESLGKTSYTGDSLTGGCTAD
jgi:hypothetical protein